MTSPPTNPASLLFISAFSNHNGFALSFPSCLDRIYGIDWLDDLLHSNWLPLTNGIPGTGSSLSITDPAGASSIRFYRVRVRLP